MVSTETYTIEDPNGNTEDVELPAGLPDMFTEQGEDSIAVVCDLIIRSFAQQSHAVVHHSEGETPADLEELNDEMESLFEDRFGVSLSEAMGHNH